MAKCEQNRPRIKSNPETFFLRRLSEHSLNSKRKEKPEFRKHSGWCSFQQNSLSFSRNFFLEYDVSTEAQVLFGWTSKTALSARTDNDKIGSNESSLDKESRNCPISLQTGICRQVRQTFVEKKKPF